MYISIYKDISELYACVKRYHFQKSKIDIVGTYIYVAMVTFSNCIQVTVWERDILNITGKITLSFVYEVDNKYNKINGKILFKKKNVQTEVIRHRTAKYDINHRYRGIHLFARPSFVYAWNNVHRRLVFQFR